MAIGRFVYNDQAEAILLGVAVGERNKVFYLSVVGPRSAVKSLWATLVARKKKDILFRYTYWVDPWLQYRGLPSGYHQFWTPLPMTNQVHAVFVARRPDLFLVTAPEGAGNGDSYIRDRQLREHSTESYRRFARFLDQHLDIPVLSEWGEYLAREGYRRGLLKSLEAGGDCLSANLISNDWAKWQEAIIQALRYGYLTVPTD